MTVINQNCIRMTSSAIKTRTKYIWKMSTQKIATNNISGEEKGDYQGLMRKPTTMDLLV